MSPAETAPGGRTSDSVDVLLADGTIARVRPFRLEDAPALKALHDEAPDTAISNRFFVVNRSAGTRYVDHLCASSPDEVTALLAETTDGVIALATAERIGADSAEVSFFVAGPAQRLGVATLLLEHLAARCRQSGLRRFTAEVLFSNVGMLRVFDAAGFDVVRHSDAGVVDLQMSIEATARAVESADRRECAAEARSLAALLEPRVVALAGAVGRQATPTGRALLAAISAGGFAGRLVMVDPVGGPPRRARTVRGVRTYPSVAAVRGDVDLLVVASPTRELPQLLEAAGLAGVRCSVVLSPGFTGSGPEAAGRRAELVELARSHDMRLIGPGCFGIALPAPDVSLDATLAVDTPAPGRLAVASQSGGVGSMLLDAAGRRGLGLAAFVSLGEKADVSGNDLLAAWTEDDRVAAAGLYLESFGNLAKFARLARRFSERKPLLAVVAGWSPGSARVRPARPTLPVTAVEAVLTQAGVLGTRTVDELVETAGLLTKRQLPAGSRLGVVCNAAGLGVLAADSAQEVGLEVPPLPDAVAESVAAGVGREQRSVNPVCVGIEATARQLGAAVTTVLDSGAVDSLLVVYTAHRLADTDEALQSVYEAARRTELPVLLVVHGADAVPPPDLPTFTAVEGATRALAHAVRYARWRAVPREEEPEPVTDTPDLARALARVALEAATDTDGWVDPTTVRDLLANYRVQAPVGEMVVGTDDAVEVANRIGFPVAVKVADPAVRSKTARALVTTRVRTRRTLKREVRRFAKILRVDDVPVLVQPMVRGGVELALSVTRDPEIGPVVSVAAGGLVTEALDDRVFLVPPLTDRDAVRAVHALRIAPLLDGYPGSPPVDVAAFERMVLAVARFAEDVPELAELDLNPVIVTPDGAACVDARMRLTESPRPASPTARGLRTPT